MMVGGLGDGCGAASSGSTTPFRNFNPSLRPLPNASSGGSTAGTILALLVQAQERRNAESLSESVGIWLRAMLRFLTEACWDDDAVIGQVQEYLAPRLRHPDAAWVLDGSDFPKQGRKCAGVAR